jgi:hypothetical protein
LKDENDDRAVECDSKWSPIFDGCDVSVYYKCNVNNDSFGDVDDRYMNDIGWNRERVFTG